MWELSFEKRKSVAWLPVIWQVSPSFHLFRVNIPPSLPRLTIQRKSSFLTNPLIMSENGNNGYIWQFKLGLQRVRIESESYLSFSYWFETLFRTSKSFTAKLWL